eukprot:CAMPEP_0206585596 /NCGR_PEP_ID=MMETSP0325_2-20121206/36512_1 /ASSEMBLY_ACC=CAM_ASM_000347 /TAXON_ID=2866 /ORGANISM="Crypthecodinium cohnii, Strain Seligo" /LENGTH=413 /DNA_ID=CAMNT_0054093175 /DNA_START=180 /DNA_END=1417 /DNA_ORIENTATION=-
MATIGGKKPSLCTLECTCNTRFCGYCQQIGGHEPASCKQWSDWSAAKEEKAKDNEKATDEWINKYAQRCPRCQASITRSGGCNHMICSPCGQHFCYVCGKDWNLHFKQAGGFDHYQCRLGNVATRQDYPNSSVQSKPGSWVACEAAFRANIRNAEWEMSLLALAAAVSQLFGVDGNYQAFLSEALSAALQAREVLKFSYVLKYQIGEAGRHSWHWLYQIDPAISELEVITTKLESVLGLSFVATAVRKAELNATEAVLQVCKQLSSPGHSRLGKPHMHNASSSSSPQPAKLGLSSPDREGGADGSGNSCLGPGTSSSSQSQSQNHSQSQPLVAGLPNAGTRPRGGSLATLSATSLDLRDVLAHIVATSQVAGFGQQLTMAVLLQTQQLLSAGRAYHELSEEDRVGPVILRNVP